MPELTGGDTTLSLEAVVVDAAGQKQTSTVQRPVTKDRYRIDVVPEGGSLVRGVPNRVLVMTTTAAGQPVRL